MSLIRSKNTNPELIIRKTLHQLGFRFRLHRKDLPGRPDIVLTKYKRVIFVNGCFWHGHNCKRGDSFPKTNKEFWQNKILKNRERDKKTEKLLQEHGWKVITIWECELKNYQKLTDRLLEALRVKEHTLL